jgi:hypothetical protein
MNVQIKPKQSSLAVKIERNDHTTLTHRNDPNQHTIKAITDLSETLADLYSLIEGLQEKINLHDDSSVEVIENITQKIDEIVKESTISNANIEANKVAIEREQERALNAEHEIKESINLKLEDLDVRTNNKFIETDSKIDTLASQDLDLKADIIELGNELSMRVDEHQRDRSDLANKIGDEASRALAAETELALNLKDECIRAQEKEDYLTNLINTETVRAQEKEASLSNQIRIEEKRALEQEDLLYTAVETEKARALATEDFISKNLTTEISRSTTTDEKLAKDIRQETKRAEAVELGLKEKIEAEALRAITEETIIRVELADEATRAIKAEEKLLEEINTETERAKEAEKVLEVKIDSETKRAEAAEKILDEKLEIEIKRATKIETELRADLDSEIVRSIEADAVLQKAIEDEAATRLSEDTSIRNYIDEHIAEVDLRTDVIDVVATKADLELCDKTKITENDIVKVLADETSSKATTYYRLVENKFVLVGKVGPYYTKAEINTQTRSLRDEDISFAGTKDFAHIISNQVPQADIDLTNKLYVDASIATEKNRATEAEKVLTDSITELSSELTTKLGAKADLVDGKIPNSQLPTTINIICEV